MTETIYVKEGALLLYRLLHLFDRQGPSLISPDIFVALDFFLPSSPDWTSFVKKVPFFGHIYRVGSNNRPV